METRIARSVTIFFPCISVESYTEILMANQLKPPSGRLCKQKYILYVVENIECY